MARQYCETVYQYFTRTNSCSDMDSNSRNSAMKISISWTNGRNSGQILTVFIRLKNITLRPLITYITSSKHRPLMAWERDSTFPRVRVAIQTVLRGIYFYWTL